MSVIDRVLQGRQPEAETLTLREAVVTVLVGSVASDGALAPEEGIRLNALLPSMHLYRQVPLEHQQHLVQKATQLVAREGAEALLPICAAVIPDDLREPIFALAVEFIFVDGRVTEREKRFVDALQTIFAIDDEAAVKIVEVLLTKSRA